MKSELNTKPTLGFWVYIMTDCVLFATLFATYAVLRNNSAAGSSESELFDLNFVLVETIVLLLSSFVCGIGIILAKARKRLGVAVAIITTIGLGAIFLGLELSEFNNLVAEGNSWQASAFLSAFFTLVGTHGLHITAGLIWAFSLLVWLMKKGITNNFIKKLTLFSMFWHFLDLVWIFIFTVVYLMGAGNL